MKNKSITYFLIAVVIALWGGIFYRIFHAMGEEDQPTISQKSRPLLQNLEEKEDSLVLVANYRDPFLGSMARAETAPKKVVSKSTAPKVVLPKVEIDWSFAALVGTIQNPKNKKKIALMNFRGREVMINEGEKVEDFTVLKVYKDSVRVSYSGSIHTYKRS